jgi:hypothetical protein
LNDFQTISSPKNISGIKLEVYQEYSSVLSLFYSKEDEIDRYRLWSCNYKVLCCRAGSAGVKAG